MWKSEGKAKLAYSSILVSIGLSILIIICVFSSLLYYGLLDFNVAIRGLFQVEWDPNNGIYGLAPLLFGTMSVMLIALTLAVPIGIFTAIFISEYLNERTNLIVKSVLEIMAGIPSIIYGLIGVSILSTFLQNVFDLQTGRTILTAGLLLAIMILPTIITLCDDALKNVPVKYREAGLGLGLYKTEMIRKSVLPIARPEMISGILLALGRAIGETMAVMLVIGSISKLPSPIYNLAKPGHSITAKIGRELAETPFASTHFNVLIFAGLILLVIILIVNLVAFRFNQKQTQLYE